MTTTTTMVMMMVMTGMGGARAGAVRSVVDALPSLLLLPPPHLRALQCNNDVRASSGAALGLMRAKRWPLPSRHPRLVSRCNPRKTSSVPLSSLNFPVGVTAVLVLPRRAESSRLEIRSLESTSVLLLGCRTRTSAACYAKRRDRSSSIGEGPTRVLWQRTRMPRRLRARAALWRWPQPPPRPPPRLQCQGAAGERETVQRLKLFNRQLNRCRSRTVQLLTSRGGDSCSHRCRTSPQHSALQQRHRHLGLGRLG